MTPAEERIDESVRRRLIELQGLIDGTLNVSQHMAGVLTPRIEAGSVAEREIANDETGPAEPWGARPARLAHGMAGLAWFAATQHLLALRLLLEPDNGVLITPSVVTRACVEACVRMWWLTDPDIDLRERVRRYLNDELYSVDEQLKMARKHVEGGGASVAVDECVARVGNAERWAAELGFDPPVKGSWNTRAFGEPRPRSATLIEELFKTYDEARGAAFYSVLSAVSHAVPYGVLQFFDPDPAPGGDLVMRPQRRLELLESDAQLSLAAVIASFDRMAKLFGWTDWQWESWKDHVVEVFSHALPPVGDSSPVEP